MEPLRFNPWRGNEYDRCKEKILLLGESHYMKNCDNHKDYTNEVINNFLKKEHKASFFRNLGRLFDEDPYRIWKEVAFANGIQNGLKNPQAQPKQKDIDTIQEAFPALIAELKPTKVVICSKRMWELWLPGKDEWSFHSWIDEKKRIDIWNYRAKNHSCLCVGINHPSKFFSPEKWKPIVKEFLLAK